MTAAPVGIVAAAVVPGALQVEAAALAGELGGAARPGIEALRLTDIDETGVTLALDAFRSLLAETGVDPPALTRVVLAIEDAEADDVERILRVVVSRAALEMERYPDDEEGAQGAMRAALAAAQGGPVVLVAARGTTRLAPAALRPDGARMALGVSVLFGADALVVPTGNEEPVAVPPAWGDAGAAGALCAVVEAAAGGAVSNAWRVVDAPRWPRPSRVLAAPGRSVPAETARRIMDAWADAAHREPRGAYVPLSSFHHHAAARYRTEGQRCGDCERLLFPPRERCTACGSVALAPHAFSGRGTIYAVTRIVAGGAPAEFAPQGDAAGPYRVAVVSLDEGPRVAAMLTGPTADDLEVGDSVRLVTRLLYVQEGTPRYSFKAHRD